MFKEDIRYTALDKIISGKAIYYLNSKNKLEKIKPNHKRFVYEKTIGGICIRNKKTGLLCDILLKEFIKIKKLGD